MGSMQGCFLASETVSWIPLIVFPCIWSSWNLNCTNNFNKTNKNYLNNGSVCRFCLRKRNKSSSLLNLHRNIHNQPKFRETFLQEIFGDHFARHINSVTSLRLVFMHGGLFVDVFFLLKLLVMECNRTIAGKFKLKWESQKFSNILPIAFFSRQRGLWWGTVVLDRRRSWKRMISRRLWYKLLSFLSFRSLELDWSWFFFWDVDVSRFYELSSNFSGVTSVFWTLWNQGFLGFWFGFKRLDLLFLRKFVFKIIFKNINKITFFFNLAYFAISICSSSVRASGMWI